MSVGNYISRQVKLSLLCAVLLLVFLGCETPPGGWRDRESEESAGVPPPAEPQPFLSIGEPRLESGSLLFKAPDGNIYVARSDSQTIVQLTNNSLSNGGSRTYTGYVWVDDTVVYASQRSDNGVLRMELVAQKPGSDAATLIDEEGSSPFYLYPSPDGDRVAFLGNVSTPGRLGMGSIRLDGAGRVSHGEGQPFYAAWSPSGRSLVTHVGSPLTSAGSVIGLQTLDATGDASELPLATGLFRAPSFRSDGRGFAALINVDGATGIYQLSSAGSVGEKMAQIEDSAAFTWSPTGAHLAFIDGVIVPQFGTMVGSLSVATAGAGDGRQQPPELVVESAIAFFWSPDGSKLLILSPSFLPRSEGGEFVYSAFIFRPALNELRVIGRFRPTSEFVSQYIPFFDQYQASSSIWSPDSNLVALNVTSDSGLPVVYLVDTRSPIGETMHVSFSPGATSVSHGRGGIWPRGSTKVRAVAVGVLPIFSPH